MTVQDPTNGQLTTITGLPAKCPSSGLAISCGLGTLGPGETRHLTLTMQVNDVPLGTEIVNCATVHTGSRETTTSNNESCATTVVGPDIPTTTVEPPTSSSEPTTSSSETTTSTTGQSQTTSAPPTSTGVVPTSTPGTSSPETTTSGTGSPLPPGDGQSPDSGTLAQTGSPTGVITLFGIAGLLVGLVLHRLARKPG